MAETIFVKGMIAKAPRESAPEYIKGGISIKVEELVEFLQANVKPDGWLNIDIKESKGGKWYAALNTWQKGDQKGSKTQKKTDEAEGEPDNALDDPDYNGTEDINPDDIPF